ncbi:MAG: hypothetical protein EBX41_07210 [Chitinophagia bacterium]|nr:hypothetical protein [Chitinophagia bacterium]
MDSNNIKIDDLFRQRLSGHEEAYNPPAWENMKALLEKDDRNRPFGFFLWQRGLIYLAIALLLSKVPYTPFVEQDYAIRGLSTCSDVSANNAGSIDNTVVSSNAPATHGTQHHKANKASKHQATHTASASYANHATGSYLVPASSPAIAGNTPNQAINHADTPDMANAVASNTPAKASFASNKGTSTTHIYASATPHTTIAKTTPRSSINTATTNNNAVAANQPTKPVAPAVATKAHAPVAKIPANASTTENGEVEEANEPANTTANPTASTKSHTASTAVTTAKKNKPATIVPSTTTTAKNNTAVATSKATTVPSNDPTATGTVASATTAKVVKKKQVNIKIKERYTNSGNRWHRHYDTIDVTNSEYDEAVGDDEKGSSTNPLSTLAAAKPATAGKASKPLTNPTASNTKQAKTSGASATDDAEEATEAKETPASRNVYLAKLSTVYPQAKVNLESYPPMPVEPQKFISHKKKAKNHTMEALSDAFIDMHNKITGIQCSPGLTAGINATFFGPNHFRGFQFGAIAAFEIDNKWTFLTELKYFNRANSNYTMYDSYYDYSTLDSIDNKFTFSTLHSFELPVSLRYTFKKVNFSMGANFVYSLGVNTNNQPLRYSLTSLEPGLNTAPTFATSDFAARFGIGYLFGISFRVAPNLNVDIRNVQTFWDNKTIGGAKTVSEQLYKSPSIQFSIQYRFGHGDDE